MSEKWRGSKWEHASSEHRLLLLAGVSSKQFDELPELPDFIPFKVRPKKDGKPITLTAERQSEVYQILREDPEGSLLDAQLIVIGSRDVDDTAMHMAIDLVRSFIVINDRYPVKIVNLGSVPDRKEKNENGELIGKRWWAEVDAAAVVILHNVAATIASDERIELLRDLLTRCSAATCIVVVAGANPVSFAFETLLLRPSVALYVESSSDKDRKQSR